MALFLLTRAILEDRPIDVFNHGRMQRDFTYVDDIVEAVLRVNDRVPAPDPDYTAANPDPASSDAPYRVFNIGNHQPVPLMDFIGCIEQQLGRQAEKRLLPMQRGGVAATYADTAALEQSGSTSRRARRWRKASSAWSIGIATTTRFERKGSIS
jgi:UDP-glucuronate 4-epimerase